MKMEKKRDERSYCWGIRVLGDDTALLKENEKEQPDKETNKQTKKNKTGKYGFWGQAEIMVQR